MQIGTGIWLGIPVTAAEAGKYSITLTGTTNGEALQGDTIGLSITPNLSGESVTYQWQENGSNIAGANTTTEIVEIGTTHSDASFLGCIVTIDGTAYTSNSATIRYAAGTAPAVADDQSFTVDSAITTIDASASGANLTFSYTATGLASGLSINASTGAITGTPDTAQSGTAAVTATDQYGRRLEDTFTWTASLRAQATAAGALEDQTFVSGNGVQTYDASGDFTTNGNDLTFSVNLVTGVTIDGATGVVSFDTDAMTEQTGTSIVVTAADEYGRETTSGFSLGITASSLEITAEPDGTIAVSWQGTLDEITVSGGTDFDGTYTTFHDGTALIDTHLDGVAGRALAILDTTGTGEVGQTLTAGDILALYEDGQDEPTVSIQWQRDGVDIAGATGSTYTLVSADAGTDVRPTFILSAAGVSDVTETGPEIGVAANDVAYLGTDLQAAGSGVSGVYTFSSKTLGTGKIYVALQVIDTGGNTISGVTVDGVAATEVPNTFANALSRTKSVFYEADVTSASGDIVVTMDANVGRGIGVSWWRDKGGRTVADTATAAYDWGSDDTEDQSLDVDVQADDIVLAAGGAYWDGTGAQTWDSLTGVTAESGSNASVTEDFDLAVVYAARHEATGTESPRTISIGHTGTTQRDAGSALVLR